MSLKPFYRRSSDLRHPIGDGIAQIAWGADLGLKGDSIAAGPMYTLIYRREVVGKTGTGRWEYRGRCPDGVASDWVTETESQVSFTPFPLDTFHGLTTLNPLNAKETQPTARLKQRTLLSSSEALTLYPIVTAVTTSHGRRYMQIYRVG